MKKKGKILPDEFENKMKSLGILVSLNRQMQDMTMEQLAYQSKVSVSYIWQIEMGYKNITYYTLWCIAQSLDIPSGQLLYEFDIQPISQNECPLKHILKQCSNCQKKDFQTCCYSTGSESVKHILSYINSILNEQ